VNKIRQIITARRISLGLILLLAALMYLSTLIPQEIDATPGKIEAWRLGHQWLLWLIDGVNLHRIYAQPWFAALILFSTLALGISSLDQLSTARKKLYTTGIGTAEEVAASISEQLLQSVAKSQRYCCLQTGSKDLLKFVRNPWGYFGVLLLHLGMTLVIAASLYVSLTGRQSTLILLEGEQPDLPQSWDASEHGLLAAPLKLPGTIRLDKVNVSFDKNNQPAEVTSNISFLDDSGRVDTLSASINRISKYRGLRIYHASQYGSAFTVSFTDKTGTTHAEKILAQQPVNLTTAGYSDDFGVTWSPYLFSAKYFADADKKTMLSRNPQLIVRFLDGKKELARTTLTSGNTGMLGEYRLRLLGVGKWSKLIIVDIRGMSVIFTGFAIIMLGGLVHYLTPPREIIGIRLHDGRYRVYWRATVFSDFFVDERDSLTTALNREIT
jgi:hypothetical protein